MTSCDLAIVGAGPAGLAAAAEAAECGLAVTIIDDNRRAGGQYFRQPPQSFRHTADTPWDKDRIAGAALIAGLSHPRVTYLNEATVWDVPAPGTLAIAAGARSGRLRAGAILIAAGAQDRPAPFPGWTLPGVISAGGVQNLLKGQRIVPGTRAVVAGNGPLLLLIGANLVRAGVRVAAVVEAAPIWSRVAGALPLLLGAPELVAQAVHYRSILLRAGVPVLTGWMPIAAEGVEAVSACTVAPIDRDGRIDRARVRRIGCDLMVSGFGLMPSIELPRLVGCALDFDRRRGGWIARRDARFQSSVPGVYLAGDGAAIGGAAMAMLEGRLVAQHVAAGQGRSSAARIAALQRRWTRFDRFRRGLERVYAPPRSFLQAITAETIVCRCEDVTLADLDRRRGEQATSAVQLKSTTRITMGRCQGRNCAVTLAELVAAERGVEPAAVALPRPRPPARPVPIGDMLHEDLPAPEIPADPHLPRGQRV